MFAYCLNSPVMYDDPFGYLAFPGEIHNAVVRHIWIFVPFMYKEQKITYSNGGWGRADLISADGQVWDVKRNKPRQIAKGKTQVRNYVNNTWKNNPTQNLSVGGWIAGDSFSYKSGLTTYWVTYSYAGDGIIAYDYYIIDFNWEAVNAAIAVSAAVALATGCIRGLLSLERQTDEAYAK